MDFYLTAPSGSRIHFPINPERITARTGSVAPIDPMTRGLKAALMAGIKADHKVAPIDPMTRGLKGNNNRGRDYTHLGCIN